MVTFVASLESTGCTLLVETNSPIFVLKVTQGLILFVASEW